MQKIQQIAKNQTSKNVLVDHLRRYFANKDITIQKASDNLFDLKNNKTLTMSKKKLFKNVNQVIVPDISNTSSSHKSSILAINKGEEKEIHYGERGINTSRKFPKPEDLLKYNIKIPAKSISSINIKDFVPFKTFGDDYDITFVGKDELIQPVIPFIERVKNGYSIKKISDCTSGGMGKVYHDIERTILENPKKEMFYEETTLPVDKPSKNLRSSGTLMHFLEDINGVTDTHFHPGERYLIVYTNDKPAGVTLNFAGIEEVPTVRSECEITESLDPLSIYLIKFSPYTHHQFHGNFVCFSIHPREGMNLIKSSQKSTQQKGFLEQATVISKKPNSSLLSLNDMSYSTTNNITHQEKKELYKDTKKLVKYSPSTDISRII